MNFQVIRPCHAPFALGLLIMTKSRWERRRLAGEFAVPAIRNAPARRRRSQRMRNSEELLRARFLKPIWRVTTCQLPRSSHRQLTICFAEIMKTIATLLTALTGL